MNKKKLILIFTSVMFHKYMKYYQVFGDMPSKISNKYAEDKEEKKDTEVNEVNEVNEVTEVNEVNEVTNRCLICGVDLGDCNPRQLCGKTYCYNK